MTANGCSAHARWAKGCRGCQRISSVYERKRRAAIRAGTWKPLVPQAQVQDHLDHLVEQGATYAGIAEASGLSIRTLFGIRHRQVVQGETASAILSVQAAGAPLPNGLVPVVGPSRRLQALTALGWSLSEQARQIGMALQQLAMIANAKQSAVTVATAEAIRDMFERLCSIPGGSTRACNDAKRKGWLPPLAWDDLDDPGATPALGESADDLVDEVAIERALEGQRIDLTGAELVAALQVGVARGEALSHLAERFGINCFGARKMLGGELTPRREKQARIEAEVRRIGHLQNDFVIAVSLDVHHSTVARARKRLAERQSQIAS